MILSEASFTLLSASEGFAGIGLEFGTSGLAYHRRFSTLTSLRYHPMSSTILLILIQVE